MVVNSSDLEALADATYQHAGLTEGRAVTPLYLARRLLDSIERVDGLSSVVILRGNALSIRANENPRMVDWRVVRVLAFWALRRNRLSADEATTDALAACLRTPQEAFRRVARDTGADLVELAWVFGISESAAALRYGETMGARVMLFAAGRATRVRGRGPIGPARVLPITDAPGRKVRLYAAA